MPWTGVEKGVLSRSLHANEDIGMTRIAVIGGSGALGFGLALRWARANQNVIVGSRRLESAQNAANEIRKTLQKSQESVEVCGLLNPDAAAAAEIVVLAVPFEQQTEALDAMAPQLEGKVLVDTTVPLKPPRVGTVQLPTEGCSALRVQARVGNAVRVVSAFQNVAAQKLKSLEPLDCDVLVSGDDRDACQAVIGLVEAAQMRGYFAGPLANAAAAEALTSVLITINRQFKCQAGIRVVGLSR